MLPPKYQNDQNGQYILLLFGTNFEISRFWKLMYQCCKMKLLGDFQELWLGNKLDEWWSWPKEKIGEMESEMHPS